MLACRSRDTLPELALRSEIHRLGLRYRVSTRPERAVRRTADVVFRAARVAVFVDGCFWHGCPDHFVAPKTNPDYWLSKIKGNVRRDRDTDRALTESGWLVIRVWEHEASKSAAARIAAEVRFRRS